MMRDKVWFFGALRRALSSSGISRTSAEVAAHRGVSGLGRRLFDNDSESWQPFVKVTSSDRHATTCRASTSAIACC